MASTAAISAVQAIYEHVDAHVRELLPPPNGAEVDSALMIIAGAAGASGGTFGGGSTGSTTATIGTGVAGCWSFDFKTRITGWYIQEFDGTAGSIVLGLARAPRGLTPSFSSIVGSAPPTIASGRYAEDATLVGWTDTLERGDLVRVSVTSASGIARVLFGLRIRRLEP